LTKNTKVHYDTKYITSSHNILPLRPEFVPNFVAMATGVGREKKAIGSIRWPIPENLPIGAKISQKFFIQSEL